MIMDNHYVHRYRSIPAASFTQKIDYINDNTYTRADPIHPRYRRSVIMHYHPELEVIYVREGEWHYRTAYSEDYLKADAGDIIFFMPYEPHEAAVLEGTSGFTTDCICFDTSMLGIPVSDESMSLSRGITESNLRLPMRISADEEANYDVRACFKTMLDAIDNPERCEDIEFFGAMFGMFAALKRHGCIINIKPPDEKKTNDRDFAREVIDYTEAHYTEPISTASVSEVLNYTEAYFCRRFRQTFRMCYSEYLAQLRISKVRPLLMSMSVTEAAESCGFSHMSRFSKQFKHFVGITPTEYKKQMKK